MAMQDAALSVSVEEPYAVRRQNGVTQIVDQIGAYQEAGAQRVMLQWLDLEDQGALDALAKAVL